jgi:transcription initiation factor TFIIB
MSAGGVPKWSESKYFRERAIKNTINAVIEVSKKLGVSEGVAADAVKLVVKLNPYDLWKLPVRARAVAFIYMASEMGGVLVGRKKLEEMCAAAGVDCGMVRSIIARIRRALGVGSSRDRMESMAGRLAESLGLPDEVRLRAVEMARAVARSPTVSGKSTSSLVAAIVYMAAKESGVEISKIRVAEAVGITDTTLRSRVKEVRRILGSSGRQ